MAKKGCLAFSFLALVVAAFLAILVISAMLLYEEPRITEKPVRNDTYCKQVYDEINSDLQKANYCAVGSDCIPLLFEGPYIEFGCYHFVNKDVNASDLFRRVSRYDFECDTMIDLCAPVPDAACVSGKCVAAK